MNSLGQVKERVKITDRFESILNKFITPFKFGIWICACFCNVLACVLAILLFIELLHIWILLFFCFFFSSIYVCASSSIEQDWMSTWKELTRATELARSSKTSLHDKTSLLPFSSPYVIVKQFQQSLLLIAVLVWKWCRIAYWDTNEPAHLM